MRYSEVARNSESDDKPLLISVAKAGEMLGLSAWDVRSLCKTHQLRAGKPGRSWLIDPESVREYAARITAAPAEDQAS